MTAVSIALAVMVVVSGCTGGSVGVADAGFQQVDAVLPDEFTERLNTAVADAVVQSGASGAIAGVWAPWAGTWTTATGKASFDDSAAAMSTEMPFRVGGGIGTMACTVLLALAERNEVSLDDPVDKYLDRVPGIDGITLGQTCQQTTGLADYVPSLRKHFIENPTRDWPPRELLASGLAIEDVDEPGARWSYSSTNLFLLGLALERRTGQTWDQLIRETITRPLDMAETSLVPPTRLTVEDAPHGYAATLTSAGEAVCDARRDVTEQSSSMAWIEGGGVSTLEDLSTWTQALATGALLSEEMYEAQWKTVPINTAGASWREYGVGAEQQGPLRGFAGEVPGYLSAAYTDPSSGLTVVILLNNSTPGAEFVRSVAFRLASIASRAPAAGEREMPLVELPWSEQQMIDASVAQAVCPSA